MPQAPDDQLIGRERERAELERALAAAQAGQGGLFLLGGEAGVGKGDEEGRGRRPLVERAIGRAGGQATHRLGGFHAGRLRLGRAIRPATAVYPSRPGLGRRGARRASVAGG